MRRILSRFEVDGFMVWILFNGDLREVCGFRFGLPGDF